MASEIKQSARFEFPSMLYDMLEDVSGDPRLARIVSWMPHGRAFRVHKPDDFEVKIMPKYFRERYSSFRYLLEQWGFQGLRRGRDRGAYYNVLFVRGERDNIENVTKEIMLSVMPEYLAPKDEPDFYSCMPAHPEHPEAPTQTSRRGSGNKKRKRTQSPVEGDDSLPETKKRTNQSRKKGTKKTETRPSETKELASDSDYVDPPASGTSSTSSSVNTPSLDTTLLRRTGRNTPRVQYSEVQHRQPKEGKIPPGEEASNRKVSRKSKGAAKSSDRVESMGKDPLPIMFRPTKPVFSGFGISFEKLRLIVMKADEVESHDSFVVKRLVSRSEG